MRGIFILLAAFGLGFGTGVAGETSGKRSTSGPQKIDLAAALRLAGANSLDIQIAHQRLAAAEAQELLAVEQFFPTLTPGLTYRRHENNIQAVDGPILNVEKELYVGGATVTGQVDLGEAIFTTLAAQQLKRAAQHAVGAQTQQSILDAASAYLDLAQNEAEIGIATESLRIAEDYAGQLREAVDAGLAFKGDLLRAEAQVSRDRVALDQAREQTRIAAAHLAQVLHLDSAVNLEPQGDALVLIKAVQADRSLESLIMEAMSFRPELKQYAAQIEAAKKGKQGALYGPLVPTVGAQVFYGGLGGGAGSPGPASFGQSSDYSAAVSWRIGPGGLFDAGRIRQQESHLHETELEFEKIHDQVVREVVDAYTRIHSAQGQLGDAAKALKLANETLDLTRQRREFAVGVVLENIVAEQDLTKARLDYLHIVSAFNRAQFELRRAIGVLHAAEDRRNK